MKRKHYKFLTYFCVSLAFVLSLPLCVIMNQYYKSEIAGLYPGGVLFTAFIHFADVVLMLWFAIKFNKKSREAKP